MRGGRQSTAISDGLGTRHTPFDSRVFLTRIALCVIGMMLATGLLVARLVYLQIVGQEHYATLSRDNRIRISPIPPNRGVIFDRNGEVLADNIPTYSLEVVPVRAGDLKRIIADLTELLGLTEDELQRFNSTLRRSKPYDRIPLRLQLSEEEIARFAVRMPRFPGVEVRAHRVRTYPYGNLTSHVVGYVGRISQAEMELLDRSAYSGTLHIGKSGIEKSYETLLHGSAGYEEIETDVTGRPLRSLGSVAPLSGNDLTLSLDIKLQKVAYDALGEHSGAVVALEPATGRILAMASKPAFDPTPFVNGISRKAYELLQQDAERPLYDRALRGLYPPGSTVKPFVAMAGLEAAKLNPATRVSCPGWYSLPGSSHRYRDSFRRGHGAVDLRYAVTSSCDVYFYKLAVYIGIDKLHDYMARFGFGQKTGIDLDGEMRGLFPSREWKRRVRKADWSLGETVISGIGQGYVQATPLQLARAAAIMANRGRVVTPRLVDTARAGGKTRDPHADDPLPPAIEADPKHWKLIVDAMVDVVHSGRGTASRIGGGLPFRIAAKTGTAQVFSVGQRQNYRTMKVKKKLRDHALFIAFAPAQDPKIAVAVVAENSGFGGKIAAPIARALITSYLQVPP